MAKRRFNFWWDLLGFMVIILLGLTAHIVDEVVPLYRDTFLRLSSETWRHLHGLTGIMLLTFVVVHIALHWRWISNQFRRVGQ